MALYHIRTLFMLLAMGLALLLFVRMRGRKGSVFLIIGLITALALPTEALGYWTTLHHVNNALLYNIFTWVEFLALIFMVHTQRPQWRTTLASVGALGTAVLIVVAVQTGAHQQMYIESIVVMALLIALTLGALLWSLANTSVVALHRVPEFWVFMGLLLYFGALPPVVTLARAVAEPTIATTLWTIVPLLCAMRYILTAYAYWMAERRPLSEHG